MPKRGKYFTKWDEVTDLGKVSDRFIAERLGCSTHSVRAARLRRNISPFKAPVRYTVPLKFYIEFDVWDRLETIRETRGDKFTSIATREAIKLGLPLLEAKLKEEKSNE